MHRREIAEDIRELGSRLGDVLAAQTSDDALETVEESRTLAIDYRAGDLTSRTPLREHLQDLSPARTSVVARAFTTYFELINLVEERERVRAIRNGEQEGTLADGLDALADAVTDVDVDVLQQALDDVFVQPTFTAHPTEARRKTVKAKLRTIGSVLEALDERHLTDRETDRLERALDAEVTSLWQTPQIRDRRPEPEDEARNVQWYLENVLLDVVGELYHDIDRQLAEATDVDVPPLFAFRSWAGSDRDGNPYVTPEVTTATLERQREVVVDHYRRELKELSGVLSQDAARVDVGERFEDRLTRDFEQFPTLAETIRGRYPNEPYRQKLKVMRERLARVDDGRPGGYDEPDELIRDLEIIAESLRANCADVIATAHVDPLWWQVRTFGFTLASLDLRDHQQNHTEAVTETLSRAGIDYDPLTEAERVEFLTDAILQDGPLIDVTDTGGLSATASRVLRRFARLDDWHRAFGPTAVDTYCISMCEEPSHVLEVLFLADQAGIVDLPGYCGLDVVPLLETEYALSGARRIMGTLFENEAYAAALAARDGTQEIMLGYSDSNKENGYLAAQWSLYRNQKRLAAICEEYDVDLRLFHGRGGSISRGGGPMNETLLAFPNESVTGPVKYTEQGEAIAEKYGNPTIAKRELEQMLNGQVRARLNAIQQPTEGVPDEWVAAMETASEAARDVYQDLLAAEGFVSYFEQATPITVIEDLNLGSRPASRSGERSVEDLRAIPWVFSWTQARCIIPGWYSLAAGLDAYLDTGGDVTTLEQMYEEWPFFRTMIDNAALALAKTDLEIAEEYAALATADVRDRFFPRIRDEYERATGLVRDVTGRDTLLDQEWLQESLQRRNPYVDPLNLIQVQLLDTHERSALEERALRLTVKGIAAGMKNTG